MGADGLTGAWDSATRKTLTLVAKAVNLEVMIADNC